MRLELELPPDPTHGRLRQATVLRHRCSRPVGGVFRQLFQRGDYHHLHLINADGGRPARPGLVDQSVQPLGKEASPPLADGVRGHPQIPGNRDTRRYFRPRTRQHDPTPAEPGPGPMSPDASTAPTQPARHQTAATAPTSGPRRPAAPARPGRHRRLMTGRRGGPRMAEIVARPFWPYCRAAGVRQGVFEWGASAALLCAVPVSSVCESAARSCSFSSLSLSLSG